MADKDEAQISETDDSGLLNEDNSDDGSEASGKQFGILGKYYNAHIPVLLNIKVCDLLFIYLL